MWQASAPARSFKADAAVVLALGMLISKDGFYQISNLDELTDDSPMEPNDEETSIASRKTSNDAAEESTTTNS